MAPDSAAPEAGTRTDRPSGEIAESRLRDRLGSSLNGSVARTGIFLLALAFTLHAAQTLLIPILIAVFLSILFFPMVRRLARLRIPRALSAGLIVLALLGALGLGISMLAEPAQEWISDAPRSIRQLKSETTAAKDKLKDIQELAEEVDELTTVEAGGRQRAQPVVVETPGTLQQVVGSMPVLGASVMVIVFLTFFILVSGDDLLLKLTRCGRTWGERRRIVTIARHIQAELSRYLATVTVINAALGASTAIVLYFLDVPNPLMWGTMVAIFNFAPYVGAVVSTLVLLVVGLTTFPDFTEALSVPLSFLFLTIVEGQLITPAVVGRNMTISPMMVLLSVVIWGWLWGIPGALMAVPILASFKSVCDHVPSLRFVAAFLSNEPCRSARRR